MTAQTARMLTDAVGNLIDQHYEVATDTFVESKSIDGAACVHITASNISPYGDNLSSDVWGDPVTKVVLPDGSGLGASTFIVDMRNYGRAFLGLMPTTLTVTTQTVVVTWSKSGTTGTDHSATTVINAVAGNSGAALTILDNFAHITISATVSNAMYVYLTGRELP